MVNEGVLVGDLTLMNNSKSLSVPFNVVKVDSLLYLKGEFEFNRIEYGMTAQKLAPDDVTIKYNFLLEEK